MVFHNFFKELDNWTLIVFIKEKNWTFICVYNGSDVDSLECSHLAKKIVEQTREFYIKEICYLIAICFLKVKPPEFK